MAIITGGLHGLARKKVGNVVYRDWRNMLVASAYNPNVQNPKTDNQTMVREKFAAISSLAKKLSVGLSLGLKNFCAGTKVPTRSMFIKKNWSKVSVMVPGGTPTFAYDEMAVADGPLEAPILGTPNFDAAGTIKIPHTPNEQDLVNGQDSIYCLVYNLDKKRSQCLFGVERDESEDITLLVPTNWQGDRVSVWGFCISNTNNTMTLNGVTREYKKGDASPSVYIGNGEIQ